MLDRHRKGPWWIDIARYVFINQRLGGRKTRIIMCPNQVKSLWAIGDVMYLYTCHSRPFHRQTIEHPQQQVSTSGTKGIGIDKRLYLPWPYLVIWPYLVSIFSSVFGAEDGHKRYKVYVRWVAYLEKVSSFDRYSQRSSLGKHRLHNVSCQEKKKQCSIPAICSDKEPFKAESFQPRSHPFWKTSVSKNIYIVIPKSSKSTFMKRQWKYFCGLGSLQHEEQY